MKPSTQVLIIARVSLSCYVCAVARAQKCKRLYSRDRSCAINTCRCYLTMYMYQVSFPSMNAMNLKISLSRVKSIYIPVYMYICQLPKIIKLHSLLFEIHTVLYHMKKFCQHILVLKMIVCLQFLKFSKLLMSYFN